MLPMNLAKTRATGRGGAYGELLMLHPGTAGTTTASIPLSAYRYTPYSIPTISQTQVSQTNHPHQTTIPAALAAAAGLNHLNAQHVVPMGHSSGLLHYSPSHAAVTAALYDMTCKRALAALRPAVRPPNNLTYSVSDLLNVSGLELAQTYGIPAMSL